MNPESTQTSVNPPAVKSKSPVLPVLSFVLVLIAIVGIAFLYRQNTDLKKMYDDQLVSVNKLTDELESHKRDIDELRGIDGKLTSLARRVLLAKTEHAIEGGVVTDDFYVDKIYFIPNDAENSVDAVIDVSTQPSMAMYYQGEGRFNLTDREIRAKSMKIIDEVKQQYMDTAGENLSSWNDSGVTLTIKNYEIGNTSSGDFKLVGEN